jgi:transcriptional regulator with XRE-family HTH domain
MPTFAEKLRELRERAGLTQSQLAQASGVPLGSIRNYEQGQREPYWSVAFRLAAALGVSVEAFAVCIDHVDQHISNKTNPSNPRKE